MGHKEGVEFKKRLPMQPEQMHFFVDGQYECALDLISGGVQLRGIKKWYRQWRMDDVMEFLYAYRASEGQTVQSFLERVDVKLYIAPPKDVNDDDGIPF